MVHLSHSFYLKFFVDKGINVFIWNYRNYGRSKGTPDPSCFRKDIMCVFNYLKNQIKVTGKIGVYGRSLGGIPTCYLSPYADMVIVDRSFSNLQEMAVSRFNSRFADILFKLGSCGWQSQNDFDFLRPAFGKTFKDRDRQQVNQPEQNRSSANDGFSDVVDIEVQAIKCSNRSYKLITQDKNDEIVDIQSSLMVGVAVEAAKKQFSKTNWKGTLGILDENESKLLIDSVSAIQNIEQDLFVYLNKVFWREAVSNSVAPIQFGLATSAKQSRRIRRS